MSQCDKCSCLAEYIYKNYIFADDVLLVDEKAQAEKDKIYLEKTSGRYCGIYPYEDHEEIPEDILNDKVECDYLKEMIKRGFNDEALQVYNELLKPFMVK